MMKFLNDWKFSIISVTTVSILSGLFVYHLDGPISFIPMFLAAPVGFWAGREDRLRQRYR